MGEPASKQLDALLLLAKPNERIKKKKFKDSVSIARTYGVANHTCTDILIVSMMAA